MTAAVGFYLGVKSSTACVLVEGDPRLVVTHDETTSKRLRIRTGADAEVVIRQLKSLAEEQFMGTVTDAVLAVPAGLNQRQRQDARQALQPVGINALRAVARTTCAAMAYASANGADGADEEYSFIVVCIDDAGFDIALFECGVGVVETKASSFWDRPIDADGGTSSASASELVDLDIERPLASAFDAVMLDAGIDGTRYSLPLDRLILVSERTGNAKAPDLVHRITGMQPIAGVQPVSLIAQGAALLAGVLLGQVKDVLLLDATSMAVSASAPGAPPTPIIPRGTTIPTKREETFATSSDNQSSLRIDVSEGNYNRADLNHLIGTFELADLPPLPRGTRVLTITLDLDAMGVLHVTGKNVVSRRHSGFWSKVPHVTGKNAFTGDEVPFTVPPEPDFTPGDALEERRQRRMPLELPT